METNTKSSDLMMVGEFGPELPGGGSRLAIFRNGYIIAVIGPPHGVKEDGLSAKERLEIARAMAAGPELLNTLYEYASTEPEHRRLTGWYSRWYTRVTAAIRLALRGYPVEG